MTRHICLSALVMAALLSMGCDRSTGAPVVTRTDSAGVAIVSNGSDITRLPEVTPELLAEYTLGPDSPLYRISDVHRASPEQLFVFNGSPPEVWLIRGDGTELLAAAGEGPGELGGAGTVTSMGDTTAVWDRARARLLFFGPEGLFVRAITPDVPRTRRVVSSVSAAPGEEGFLMTRTGTFGTSAREGAYRDTASSVWIDREGVVQATIGPFPGREVFAAGRLMGPVPFGVETFVALCGDQVAIGLGTDPEIRFFDRDGGLARIVRWAASRSTLTSERVEAFFERSLEDTPPQARPAARELLADVPLPDQVPAHGPILCSPAGDLWVRGPLEPELALPGYRPPPTEWLVLDPGGQAFQRVQVPVGVVPKRIGAGSILGVYFDEYGAESIREYRLPTAQANRSGAEQPSN